MRKIFRFPKLDLRKMCALAMLLAVTAILAIFGTFRIGNAIKIPTKFISVFVAAYFFGPWLGGFCGAAGDILNSLLVPVGAPLPALWAIEFLSGFLYGALFYKRRISGKGYVFRCFIAAVLLGAVDMLLVTAVLVSAGYFPSFAVAFYIRLAAGVFKAVLFFVVALFGCKYLKPLARFVRRKTR